MLNNNLNYQRVFMLIRNDVLFHYKNILAAAVAVSGLLFFIVLWNRDINDAGLLFWFSALLTGGGYIFACYSFKAMHKSNAVIGYFTLPVSAAERIAAAYLLLAVVYPAVVVVYLTAYTSLLSYLSYTLAGRFLIPVFNLFSGQPIAVLLFYINTVPVFMLGSIYFKNFSFFKTVAWLFLIVISLVAVYYIALVVFSFFVVFPGNGTMIRYFNNSIRPQAWTAFIRIVAPAVSLVAAYFRIKEARA